MGENGENADQGKDIAHTYSLHSYREPYSRTAVPPQSGGTTRTARTTGAARFSTALRGVGGRLVVGRGASARIAGELHLRVPGLPESEAPARGGHAKLHHVPFLRSAAVAAVQRNRDAVGVQYGRKLESDHEDRVPGRSRARVDLSFLFDAALDRIGADDRRDGIHPQNDQPDDPTAAAVHAVHRTAGRGSGVD